MRRCYRTVSSVEPEELDSLSVQIHQVWDPASGSEFGVRVVCVQLHLRRFSHVHVRASRIPLSAFIVEDMMAVIHAHATYRFIIHDEEDEKPRLLVSCMSYSTASSFTIRFRFGSSSPAFVFPTQPLTSTLFREVLRYWRLKCCTRRWVPPQPLLNSLGNSIQPYQFPFS